MKKIQKIQSNIIKKIKKQGFLLKVSIFCAILCGSMIYTGTVFAQGSNIPKYAKLEREIINQLNQERANNNLKALKFSTQLRVGAKIKLDDIINNKYFAHTSPQGIKAWDILKSIDYDYKYAGENLAMKFENAIDVHRAWMKSAKHKENILFENYTEVAVAVGQKRDGSLVAVEFFGKPMSAVIMKNNIIEDNKDKTKIEIEDKKNLDTINSEEKNKKDENNNTVLSGERKYNGGSGNLLTQITPNENNLKVSAGTNLSTSILPNQLNKLSLDQIMILNNMALLVVGMVCLILVVNIWVLEKEDERIIAEAKMLCRN